MATIAIAEPPAVLRIRIPAFEEVEEDLRIPDWPVYPDTPALETMRLIDNRHVAMLLHLTSIRKREIEKAEVSCELFYYLSYRSSLLEMSSRFRAAVLAKALELCEGISNGTIGRFEIEDGRCDRCHYSVVYDELKRGCERIIALIGRIDAKKTA